MTIPLHNTLSSKDKLMRYTLLKKAEKSNDFYSLAGFYRNFWAERGDEFFLNSSNNVLEEFFKPNCYSIFVELQNLLRKTDINFDTMVEIGTGHGDVINYLSSKFPQLNRFVGIDLSAHQTTINKEKYLSNKKLEFVASDGLDWVKQSGANGMIFFTSGGVLEYFTEKQLVLLLEELKKLGQIIFIAIEPIGTHVDFTLNPSSQIYGQESSFLHDYYSHFKNRGFNVWHQSSIPFESKDFNFYFIGVISK